MKIGEFASYFNTTKATIRYYTEIHLLLPIITASYPNYDEKCLNDMKDIIYYQSHDFSNKEIEEIKTIQRYSINDSEVFHRRLSEILSHKIIEKERLILRQEESIKELKKIQNKDYKEEKKSPLGLPLLCLEYIQCLCGKTFSLEEAAIENMMIRSAKLFCSCGKEYDIKDGILKAKNFDINTFDHREIHQDFKYADNKYLSIIKKSEKLLNNILYQDHSKGVVVINPTPSLFLMDTDNLFRKDGIYICLLFDEVSAYVIKSILEERKLQGNFMMMLLDDEVPISHNLRQFIDCDTPLNDYGHKKPLASSLSFLDLNNHNTVIGMYYDLKLNKEEYNMIKYDEYMISKGYNIKFKETVDELSGDDGIYKLLLSNESIDIVIRKYEK